MSPSPSGEFIVKWWRACPCGGTTQSPFKTQYTDRIEGAWVLIRGAGGVYQPDKSTQRRHVYYAGKSKTWITMERT